MSKLREHVGSLLAGMPTGSVLQVTRESLSEWYALDGKDEPEPEADLTLAQVGKRYDRKVSTVRGWIGEGWLPGSYKLNGREWRVPPTALAEFDRKQRHGDLAAWRHADPVNKMLE